MNTRFPGVQLAVALGPCSVNVIVPPAAGLVLAFDSVAVSLTAVPIVTGVTAVVAIAGVAGFTTDVSPVAPHAPDTGALFTSPV